MTDLHLIVFGYGYSGSAIAQAARDAGFTTSATMRAPMRTGAVHSGVALIPFSEAEAALRETSHIVSTVPPDDDGDPVLNAFGRAIAGAPRLRWAGYISTTGVYGDRGGAWVDEDTPVAPGPARARRRVEAEQAWTALSDRVAVDLFRTAGIYGPGRSVLDDVRAGKARRVVKPGQAFGRIHREDIAAAVVTAAQQTRPPGVRVLHLADDEPAESASVIAEAARLLDMPPPPMVPFEVAEATMGAMARSFWSENRKVASAKTQAALGLRWRYPTYRDGLRAILAAETPAKERGDDLP